MSSDDGEEEEDLDDTADEISAEAVADSIEDDEEEDYDETTESYKNKKPSSSYFPFSGFRDFLSKLRQN